MSSYHNQAIAYRPEIDGLRAIAVLPVILFHAGFELFSGGYVGVDVFFVISGYLITSIILREMEQGKFSIVRFYERRARRILPALFFVIACCLPFAWMWMFPDELKRFGQSLVAVATFSSNIYFWRTTDYFAPAAEEQPLLHTWSLAVEEQYYVLFPLFLMLCWRFGKLKVFWLTAVAAICSLLLAEWAWRNQPFANFYLLPTRAWELLAGSLIAFVPRENADRAQTKAGAQFLSLSGLLMIVYAIIFFDSKTPFPSLYTLVPIVGSVLIILFANREGIVGRILSSRALVGIGLISYSAYLWHQPVFAFLRIRNLNHPSTLEFTLAAIASIGLAWITWRFIELPSRTINCKRSLVLKIATIPLVCTFFFGLTIHFHQGFESRLPVEISEIISAESGYAESSLCNLDERLPSLTLCDLGSSFSTSAKKVAVVGDSHALHYAKAMDELGKSKNYSVRLFTSSGCPFISALDRTDSGYADRCPLVNNKILSTLRGFDLVIVSSRWPIYLESRRFIGQTGTEAGRNLDVYIGGIYLNNISEQTHLVAKVMYTDLSTVLRKNKSLIVLYGLPEWGANPAKYMLSSYLDSGDNKLPSLPRKDIELRLESTKVLFGELKEQMEKDDLKNFNFIDLSNLFCDSKTCYSYDDTGSLLFNDDDHLNKKGSKKVVQSIFQ